MKRYIKGRFQGKDRVIELEIEDANDKCLFAKALGLRSNQVSAVQRTTVVAYKKASARSSHKATYTVSRL